MAQARSNRDGSRANSVFACYVSEQGSELSIEHRGRLSEATTMWSAEALRAQLERPASCIGTTSEGWQLVGAFDPI
jgi:hypothetical protein